MDLSLASIQKTIQSLRKTKWFDIAVLVVLGVIVAGLFPVLFGNTTTACLGLLLIPVAVFVIPYWLGERRLKRFAINGVVVLVIATLIISALQTESTVNGPDPVLSSEGIQGLSPHLNLDNGSVSPYRGSPGQTFTYRVRLVTSGLANTTSLGVYLNFTQADVFSTTTSYFAMQLANSSANGTVRWYTTNRTLGGAVYEYYFSAADMRGNFTLTIPAIGPLTASGASYYVFWVIPFFFYLLIPFSFYYVILFMYWYTVRTRKMRTRLIESSKKDALDLDKEPGKGEAAGEKEGPETKPAPGEKTKKAAAFTCTNCGADVTEDDTKCPKCGAVFED